MRNPFKTPSVPPSKVMRVLSMRILADGLQMAVDLKRSRGSYIVDARNGKKYLDLFCYFSSLPIGHNHPKMHNREFLREMKEASLEKTSNSDVYTEQYAEFVSAFSRIAKPSYMKHLFFISGGALAVENALKTAFDWKVRKNLKKNKKRELGSRVIHFKEAFHGRTGYTMSLTNTVPVKTMYYPKFKWPRIVNPKLSFPITDKVIRNVERVEQRAYGQIGRAFKRSGKDIACLIIEPIQGEGGDNHFRPEFLRELGKICKEKDIMYIMDEIQTGFGTTGKWWAYQHFKAKPDIIAFGKKSQVCGIMVSKKVDTIKDNVFNVSSRINSTWGGNLADMVRSRRYMEIIKEEKLVRNADRIGKYFLNSLEELQQKYPLSISNIRGRGCFMALDCPSKTIRDRLIKRCFKNQLLLNSSGPKSVRFRPALNFTEEDADEAVRRLEKSLK